MGGQRHFRAARCQGCGLHLELCVCSQRPVENAQLQLLVIQNNHERNKPTNTVRWLKPSLPSLELRHYAVRGERFDSAGLGEPEGAVGLLFPGEEATSLDPWPSGLRRLIVLDGTWGQCSRMARRIEALRHLPTYCLPEGPPSHWGVRQSDDPRRLSTYEAIVRALALHEGPEIADSLMDHFDRIASRMLFMKAKLPKPEVPSHWRSSRAWRTS